MGLTIDINTHPYLFSDVCDTQEKERFVIDVTGLYHNGVCSMESVFARLDCAGIDRCVLSPLDLTTEKGKWMTTNEDVKMLVEKYPERLLALQVWTRREKMRQKCWSGRLRNKSYMVCIFFRHCRTLIPGETIWSHYLKSVYGMIGRSYRTVDALPIRDF